MSRMKLFGFGLFALSCSLVAGCKAHVGTTSEGFTEKSVLVFATLLKTHPPDRETRIILVNTPGYYGLTNEVALPRSKVDCFSLSRIFKGILFVPFEPNVDFANLGILNEKWSPIYRLRVEEVVRTGSSRAELIASLHGPNDGLRVLFEVTKENGCWSVVRSSILE